MEKYLHEEEKFYDLVPRYKKRNPQRRIKKTKHKHIYIDYIGVVERERGPSYLPVSICEKCGKVGDIKLWFTKRSEEGFQVALRDLKEIQKLNPKLEVIEIEKTPW